MEMVEEKPGNDLGGAPPKPFYERSTAGSDWPECSIYVGDMREVAPKLVGPGRPLGADGPDLVIADPPYGQTAKRWDRWPDGWPKVAAEVMKPNGSLWCYGTLRMFMRHTEEFYDKEEGGGLHLAQDIVWEKHNGAGMRTDRFRRVHESIAHFYRKDAKWGDVYHKTLREETSATPPPVRRSQPSHFAGSDKRYATRKRRRLETSVQFARSRSGGAGKGGRGIDATNSTEKSVKIALKLIEYSCPPGGTVLVPFCGSGSALEAAGHAGLNVVGIELRESQARDAAGRMNQGSLGF